MNRIEWKTDDAEKALDVLTGSEEWRESPDALQIRSRMIRALFAAVDVAMEREARVSPEPQWVVTSWDVPVGQRRAPPWDVRADQRRAPANMYYSDEEPSPPSTGLPYYIDSEGVVRDKITNKIVSKQKMTSVPPVKPAKPKIEVPDAAQRQLIWDEDEEH